MFIKIFALIFLLFESIEDMRFKALSLNKLIMWGVLGIVVKYFFLNANPRMLLIEIIMGIMVLFVCRISKEAIGYGDGAVILITCIICGIQQTFLSCMLSFVVFMAVAIVVLFRKGFKRNLCIPYVPCLFLGYLGGLFV